MSRSKPKIPSVIANVWNVEDFLGEGSFGLLHKGTRIQSSSPELRKYPSQVAIKFEPTSTIYPQLKIEYDILKKLHDGSTNVQGVAKCHYYCCQDEYYCLVMTLLGSSIYTLFEKRPQHAVRWTYTTVACIGIQMLERIEFLHSKGFIHRDIKPDNFIFGTNNQAHRVYVIDFGLAKLFRTQTGSHQPIKHGKQLTGTARYASINAHNGIEQSRRDDLEGLIYCLAFLLTGKLPWQGLKAPSTRNAHKYTHIMKVKEETSPSDIEKLTASPEMGQCIKEIRSYLYNQRPRYQLLSSIMAYGIMKRKSIVEKVTGIILKPHEFEIPPFDWDQPPDVNASIVDAENKVFATDAKEGNSNYINELYIPGGLISIKGVPGETFERVVDYKSVRGSRTKRSNKGQKTDRSQDRAKFSETLGSKTPGFPMASSTRQDASTYLGGPAHNHLIPNHNNNSHQVYYERTHTSNRQNAKLQQQQQQLNLQGNPGVKLVGGSPNSPAANSGTLLHHQHHRYMGGGAGVQTQHNNTGTTAALLSSHAISSTTNPHQNMNSMQLNNSNIPHGNLSPGNNPSHHMQSNSHTHPNVHQQTILPALQGQPYVGDLGVGNKMNNNNNNQSGYIPSSPSGGLVQPPYINNNSININNNHNNASTVINKNTTGMGTVTDINRDRNMQHQNAYNHRDKTLEPQEQYESVELRNDRGKEPTSARHESRRRRERRSKP